MTVVEEELAEFLDVSRRLRFGREEADEEFPRVVVEQNEHVARPAEGLGLGGTEDVEVDDVSDGCCRCRVPSRGLTFRLSTDARVALKSIDLHLRHDRPPPQPSRPDQLNHSVERDVG